MLPLWTQIRALDSPNLVGGFAGNSVTAGKEGAVIAGGGLASFGFANSVTGDYGVVGGGYDNTAGLRRTVAGGSVNTDRRRARRNEEE
jgi:hypothetical protein